MSLLPSVDPRARGMCGWPIRDKDRGICLRQMPCPDHPVLLDDEDLENNEELYDDDSYARLIRAAPDLLAAALDVLSDLDLFVSRQGPGPDRRLATLRAAIDKATGPHRRERMTQSEAQEAMRDVMHVWDEVYGIALRNTGDPDRAERLTRAYMSGYLRH